MPRSTDASLCRLAPLLALAVAATAQDPVLLGDLNPTGSSLGGDSFGVGYGRNRDTALLVLDDGVHGQELWRSDGTAAGTALVADLNPGPNGTAFLGWCPRAADTLLVVDRGAGQELWRSDGTAAGTQLLFPIASLGAVGAQFPGALQLGGSYLMVTATSSGTHDLWRTDGTLTGTAHIASLPGSPTPGIELLWAFVHGNVALIHTVPLLIGGTISLTVTDGTTALTIPDVVAARVGADVVLFHYEGQYNVGVSTFAVATRPGMPTMTMPGWFNVLEVGAHVLLVSSTEIYQWDLGTTTTLLFRQTPGRPPLELFPWLRDRLAFVAHSVATGNELWTTDGTPAGTQALDLTPGPADSNLVLVAGLGDRVLFWFDLPGLGFGSEPWVTDGTLQNTLFLGDLEPGPASSNPSAPSNLAWFSQHRAIVPVSTQALGWELWLTDGTPIGSRFLNEIVPGPNNGFSLGSIYPVGHRLLAALDDGVHGQEPFVLDLSGCAYQPFFTDQASRTFAVAGDPLLGASFELRSRGLAAADVGVAAIGLPLPAGVLTGLGQPHLVDLGAALPLLPLTPDASGAANITVAVPNLPALVGLDFVAQAGFFGPATGNTVEVSAPWWLSPGR